MIDFLKENFFSALVIVNYGLAFSAIIIVLLKNINPTKTVS
ncbi:MAG: cardiolipin synthase [Psychroserpens sp.]|jgi:cardiolipin synthase